MNKTESIIYAVGDLGPSREDPITIFDKCRNQLSQADLVFGQLEPCLSTKGTPSPQARLAMRTSPSAANAIKNAGIDIVSWASNHCMDWGVDAFDETLTVLGENNIDVIGAGESIITARKPIVKSINGSKVAFLAYCSILPEGYWATEDRRGCAPMRAFTVNEQIEHDQPGTPLRKHTFPHREDLTALINDIENAKALADIVFVSFHWGLHFIHADIADYQRQIAHAVIDTGASMVVGHHPHILKGIEIYKNAPIFYSLGNFAIESPSAFKAGLEQSAGFSEIKTLNPNWVKKDKILLPQDSLKTCIVSFKVKENKLQSVNIIPCYINDQAQPVVLEPKDSRFAEVTRYLQLITEEMNLNAKLYHNGSHVEVRC